MNTLHFANGVISMVGCFLLGLIVLHHGIKEGMLIKLGLMTMAISLFVTAVHTLGNTENWDALWSAGFALRLGLVLVGLGMFLRRAQRGSWEKAMSDWGEHDAKH